MSNVIQVSAVRRVTSEGATYQPLSAQAETFHVMRSSKYGEAVVYHPATMTFYEVSDAAAAAVQSWEQARLTRSTLDPAADALAQRVLAVLNAMVTRKPPVTEDEEEINTRRLRRLAINVTQVCNLHCPMCYATDDHQGSGTYGSDVRYVVPSVPEQSFRRMIEYYPDGIDMIQFHGGEPLLHPVGIERACASILAYCKANDVEPPAFAVITNGTCFTDQVLDIIARYGIRVTVSLDGMREVNDINRPWAAGRSAYDAAVEGLAKIRARDLGPFTIECTVSKPHLGLNLVQLAEHFQSLGATNIHMAPATVTPEHPHWMTPDEQDQLLDQWRDLFDTVMDRFATPTPLYLRTVLGRISTLSGKHREKHLCPAGTNTIAVDVTGNISACFMFTGMREFQLGRVQGRAQHDQYRQRQDRLMHTLLSHPTLCASCWADGVCGDCSAGQYITNMREQETYPVSCRYDRLLIERVILGLARLQRDPDLWARFKRNYNGAPEDDVE
ncbi:MAG TPA: radical SAM protein [Ktedonobacterales bacterium]|nr:radical SAM protein [Ktedonobacterales bacterium]